MGEHVWILVAAAAELHVGCGAGRAERYVANLAVWHGLALIAKGRVAVLADLHAAMRAAKLEAALAARLLRRFHAQVPGALVTLVGCVGVAVAAHKPIAAIRASL